MVSVTQAFSIDLSGQVCTERLDGQLYGGLSTGPDFHRGALRAARGTPVICMASRTPVGQPAVRVVLGPDEPVALARAPKIESGDSSGVSSLSETSRPCLAQ